VAGSASADLEGASEVARLQVRDAGGLRPVYRENWLTPEELDQRIDGYSWEDYWDYNESPQAKVHQLDLTPVVHPDEARVLA
jgi:hypothetical protein